MNFFNSEEEEKKKRAALTWHWTSLEWILLGAYFISLEISLFKACRTRNITKLKSLRAYFPCKIVFSFILKCVHKFWIIFFFFAYLEKKISTISFHISFTIWKWKLSRIKMKILIEESTTFSMSPTFCQLMDEEIFLNVNLIYISKEFMDLFLI